MRGLFALQRCVSLFSFLSLPTDDPSTSVILSTSLRLSPPTPSYITTDALDPYTIALEPGTFADLSELHSWGLPPLHEYRTCVDCHAALSLPSGVGSSASPSGPSASGVASLLSPQTFFPASPSLGSVTPSEAAASDASELVECPVCGTTLASLGSREDQEGHVRECLESGGGSIASGRYLGASSPPSLPLLLSSALMRRRQQHSNFLPVL